MNLFTEDQFESLAPDITSVKAAQKVYSKTSWQVYKSERAVWTAIQGSSKKPYYTRMDLKNITFKYSCPSRKFPCKHSLSLVLFLSNNDIEKIDSQDEPEWVSEWINKRKNKSENKVLLKPKKEFNLEEDKKKKNTKWKDALANISYLEMWLQDFVKNGIIDLPTKSYTYFSNFKERMVDFKLPGIRVFINEIENVNYSEPNWQEKVLKQINH